MAHRMVCALAVGFAAHLCAMPAASAVDTLNVANVSRTLFSLPLWVAQRQGFMRDEGLETKSHILDNAEKINAALHAGEMQIAMGTPEAVIVDGYRGGTLRIIAGNTGKLPHFIITKPEIKTLAQLRGANIGILSEKEGSTYVVQDIAKAIGLTPADYRMTAVGGAPTRWRLLKEGRIDAGLQPFPLSYEAEAAGFNNLGSVIPFVPDWQFTTVNVDQKWAQQNRDVVVRFLRALQRGRDYMNTHRDEVAKIAAEELRTSVELAARALGDTERLGILDPQLALSDRGIVRVFETLQKSGDIAQDRKFDLNTFADLSYWRQSRDRK